LHASPNIIRVIKPTKIRWAGHVARVGEMVGNSSLFWLEKLKERDHSENLSVDGKIILQWILREIRWESVD